MRLFIKKIALVFSILLLLSASFVLIAYSFRSKIINYQIPNDKHIVFMGNSQFEMGINDEDFEGVVNLGRSAKLYMMMAIDMENLIKINTQIDTVVLTVSPFTIRKDNCDAEYYNKKYMNSITYYAPYLTFEDWKYLPNRMIFAKDLCFGGCLKYFSRERNCGGYRKNSRDNLAKDIMNHKNSITKSDESFSGEHISIHELKRIGRLCKEHDIVLILMSPPTYMADQIYNVNEFQNRVDYIKTLIEAEDYWNYFDMELPKSCFSDITHLNWEGAAQFTNRLKKRMGRI